MSVVTFWSNEKNETAQTLSLAAVATQMAIEHNYKILVISTKPNDNTMEACFWDLTRENNLIKDINGNLNKIGLDSGIDGLAKTLASNRTTPSIVTNYTKIVFRERLEILPASYAKSEKEQEELKSDFINIIKIANKYYDIIFVDLTKGLQENFQREILESSDVIVSNLTQRPRTLFDYAQLREKEDFLKKKNVILLIGRYDRFSKYNSRNIAKLYKQRREPCVVPYNTLFFEACGEGKIVDLFLRLRTLQSPDDKNVLFAKDVNNTVETIIYKIQEAQMKI